MQYRVSYLPAESDTGMFGGNSNWRGPIWMPVNMLIIRALLHYYAYYGNDFTIECPTGSGRQMTLYQVAEEIARRLAGIFLRDKDGRRPVYGGTRKFQEDPHWRDDLLFFEYFHGNNGPASARATRRDGPDLSRARCTDRRLEVHVVVAAHAAGDEAHVLRDDLPKARGAVAGLAPVGNDVARDEPTTCPVLGGLPVERDGACVADDGATLGLRGAGRQLQDAGQECRSNRHLDSDHDAPPC
jgi:hypothetical protein